MAIDVNVQVRNQLIDSLQGGNAHADFNTVIADSPTNQRGVRPHDAPHSAWQLMEHLRLTQSDILEFSRNPDHQSPKWPEGYWPKSERPPDEEAWDQSIEGFRKDLNEFIRLVSDSKRDLFTPFEWGDGQNLMREALLVIDHNSYHLGQLAYLRKQLGIPL
jgi:hypothetical protein